jgi:hypothetical protein
VKHSDVCAVALNCHKSPEEDPFNDLEGRVSCSKHSCYAKQHGCVACAAWLRCMCSMAALRVQHGCVACAAWLRCVCSMAALRVQHSIQGLGAAMAARSSAGARQRAVQENANGVRTLSDALTIDHAGLSRGMRS